MKKNVSILVFILIIFFSYVVYAAENDTMQEQQESFGISKFLKESEKYSSDFYEDIDLSKIFNKAVTGKIEKTNILKKIINIFGKETTAALKTLTSILVIIIIHSILKALTDSLKSDNISQIIYYMQYILIVTVIMNNFFDIIEMVKRTTDNLVGFINILVPLLITLMMYTGNLVTSSVVEPIILFMINLIANSINQILIPITLIITVISIVSKISDKIQIDKLSKLLNSGVIWFLGVVLTLFVATISIEGSLSSSVDGITAKTTKAAVSTVIPVVGKILR